MSLITKLLEGGAAKKENRLKQGLLDKGAAISREEFDKRIAEILASDQRQIDLSKRGYQEGAANEDATFAALLDNARAGYDEQGRISDTTTADRMSVEKSAFDQQMEALGGLMTAQRGARLKMQEAADSERTRQREFQAQADGVAAALPGQIGFDAQTTGRNDAFARRASLIQSTAPGSDTPAWAKGAASAFASADRRGTDLGLGDSLAAARVSSYGDAFQGAERGIGKAADDISLLTNKAEISRSALPAELGVGQLEGSQAKERADFATALSKEMGGKRDAVIADRGQTQTDNSSRYRDATGGARKTFGQQQGDSLGGMFDRLLGAEGAFISGRAGSSQNLENKLISLNNFKMNGTRVTSPLAGLLREVDKAAEQAARAYAGGGG